MNSQDYDMPSIGPTIRRLRLRKKLRQEDLAQAAGVSDEYISMLETGKRNNPAAAFLCGIAAALATTPDAILEEAGWLSPQEQIGTLMPQEHRFIEGLRAITNSVERQEILDHVMALVRFSTDVDEIVQQYRLARAAEEREEYETKEEG